MSRLYAICALAEGEGQTILSALPGVSYFNGGGSDPEPGRGRRIEYSRNEETYTILLISVARGVTFPISSAAGSGDWDVWILVADSRDAPDGYWKWIAAIQRHVLKQGGASYVLGPYSLAHAVEQYSAQLDPILRPGGVWSFPILAGDIHDDIVTIDYRPTQQEVDNDTDPELATLFPV